MAQDIYPLGPTGQSLPRDIISFIVNNVYQTGQGAKGLTQALGTEPGKLEAPNDLLKANSGQAMLPAGIVKEAARIPVQGLLDSDLGKVILRELSKSRTPFGLRTHSDMSALGEFMDPGLAARYGSTELQQEMIKRGANIPTTFVRSDLAPNVLREAVGDEGIHALDLGGKGINPLIKSPNPIYDRLWNALSNRSRSKLTSLPTYVQAAARAPRIFQSEIGAHLVDDMIGGRVPMNNELLQALFGTMGIKP